MGKLLIICLTVFCCSNLVESDVFYDLLSKTDRCESLCEQNSLGTKNERNYSCCCRGCRFFNLVYFIASKNPNDLNSTLEECKSSCNEAYNHVEDRNICITGCINMFKQKQTETAAAQISWAVYIDEGSNALLLQPDFEQDDVLTDPGLRKQLLGGVNSNQDLSHIPETYVRTLPVDEITISEVEESSNVFSMRAQNAVDWFDCAARKAGIPRLFLASAVIFAVLIAIWLCLSHDKSNLEYLLSSASENKESLIYQSKHTFHSHEI